MSASAVAMSGSPVKVKQLRKRPSSCDDVLEEVNHEKWCIPLPRPSCSGKNSEKKKCVCAPTKHAGSFRCRLHRTHSHHSHKLSVLSKKGKGTQVDFISTEDVVNPSPPPAEKKE